MINARCQTSCALSQCAAAPHTAGPCVLCAGAAGTAAGTVGGTVAGTAAGTVAGTVALAMQFVMQTSVSVLRAETRDL
jgi:hypothetical protein